MAKAIKKVLEKKPRKDKKEVVREIKKRLEEAQAIVLADFRGLNVHEISDLRKRLGEMGIEFRVLKNTLTRRAAHEVGLEELDRQLEGPTALALSYTDPVAPAKALIAFSREHEFLKIKGGVLQGRVLEAPQVRELAFMPPKVELIARLAGVMQAPIANLVYVLSAPMQGFVTALKAVAEKKSA
jgi:large subunit ribosomal protein L10